MSLGEFVHWNAFWRMFHAVASISRVGLGLLRWAVIRATGLERWAV